MWNQSEQDRTVSLASIEAKQQVVIRHILFDAEKKLCDALSLYEGDIVTCCATSTTRLYLRGIRGRTIALERDHARYIEVSAVRAPVKDRRMFALP